MSVSLFLDDQASLVARMRDRAEQLGVYAKFLTSISDARELVKSGATISTVVTDYVFEGEDENDPRALLREIRKRNRQARMYVFTGKFIPEDERAELDQLGVTTIAKYDPKYSPNDVLALLTPTAETSMPTETSESVIVDVAELRLVIEDLTIEKEAIQEQLIEKESERALMAIFIDEVVGELDDVPEAEDRGMFIMGQRRSVAELREDVRNLTPIGRRLIAVHMELSRQTRKVRRKTAKRDK
jgi:hypothetical protein